MNAVQSDQGTRIDLLILPSIGNDSPVPLQKA